MAHKYNFPLCKWLVENLLLIHSFGWMVGSCCALWMFEWGVTHVYINTRPLTLLAFDERIFVYQMAFLPIYRLNQNVLNKILRRQHTDTPSFKRNCLLIIIQLTNTNSYKSYMWALENENVTYRNENSRAHRQWRQFTKCNTKQKLTKMQLYERISDFNIINENLIMRYKFMFCHSLVATNQNNLRIFILRCSLEFSFLYVAFPFSSVHME